MRLSPVLPVALVALLVASVAFAAKPQSASAVISEVARSGVIGTADLKIDELSGHATIRGSISPLKPGVLFVSVIYLNTTSCGSGVNVVRVPVARLTANKSGKATFNTDTPPAALPLFQGGASLS